MDELKNYEKIREKQVALEGCKIGEHKWSGFWCDPCGLTHECLICGFKESGKFVEGKLMINPPLDKDGFLERSKL